MIRLTVLSAVIGFLAVYAWRDWYRALCGLIVLLALLEHKDMPRTMFGVPGLNPWNFLLLVIVLAWLAQRRREGLRWDMPGHLSWLLILYLGVIVVGFIRLMGDRRGLHWNTAQLLNVYLLNSLKFAVPGLLLFDGCRTRERFQWAMGAILCLYLLLGLQIIRWMVPGLAAGEDFATRAQRVLRKEIGYHRVDLSVTLAGAFWAFLAMRPLVRSSRQILILIGASLAVLAAQALTGGRGGYVGWVAAGLVLCLLRWPRSLLLVPVAAVLVLTLAPGVVNRALEGFVGEEEGQGEAVDLFALTAGRSVIWPLVIEKIGESPIVGHGSNAMERLGLDETAGNPHSAYLELLLDTGVLGFLPIVAFYGCLVAMALSLLRDARSPTFLAMGGVASGVLISTLVGSITGQSFYPREGSAAMWCVVGLLVRVALERSRVTAESRAGAQTFGVEARLPLDALLWSPLHRGNGTAAVLSRPGPFTPGGPAVTRTPS